MELPIFIDFVCPYCCYLVALLDRVKEAFPHNITFLPCELTPEGNPPVNVCADQARKDRFERTLGPASRRIGLDIKLPPNVCPRPYTQKAFEGFHFASDHGLGTEYCRRVMTAYFTREQDIGSVAVLTELAAQVGLDPVLFSQALNAGTYAQRQREAVNYARQTAMVRVLPTIRLPGGNIEGFIETEEELLAQLREKSGA